MGSWFSSAESKTDEKLVDTNGQVNNNIIIQEANDTHTQMIINEKLLYATYLLCLIEMFKVILYLVNAYKRHIKKKFEQSQKGKV